MRGEEEREGGDTNKGRTQQGPEDTNTAEERGRGERRGERDRREDTTTDDDEEEEERPHGRLTVLHGRDLADVPRGQVLVEGGGRLEH